MVIRGNKMQGLSNQFHMSTIPLKTSIKSKEIQQSTWKYIWEDKHIIWVQID